LEEGKKRPWTPEKNSQQLPGKPRPKKRGKKKKNSKGEPRWAIQKRFIIKEKKVSITFELPRRFDPERKKKGGEKSPRQK